MPVKVEMRDDKWRVVNSDTGDLERNAAGTPVDGGGHDTQEEAQAQARAINARKGVRAELVNALSLGLPGFLTNEDPAAAAGLAVAIKTGEPVGPFAGITEVPIGVLEMMPTTELARFKDDRVLFWVPLEASELEGDSATAGSHTWVVRKSGDGYGVFKGSQKGGQHKTREAAQKCADARNRMARAGLPSDLGEDVMHTIVARMEELELAGVREALTHNSETADEEPQWGEVDKTPLPNNAHADSDLRSFPHHFVRNGRKDPETGRFVDGDLFLHRGGLAAARAAAAGARSGQPASQAVIDHLASHPSAEDLAKAT